MAKFVYRMQSILDIKYKLEEQERTAYGIANRKLQEENARLQELLIRRTGYERHLKELAIGEIKILEIKETKQAIDAMKSIIRDQMMRVHSAEKNLEVARLRLNQVMQDRKAHEKLKEKAFEQFKQELLEEEAKEIDQLVSFTYGSREEEE